MVLAPTILMSTITLQQLVAGFTVEPYAPEVEKYYQYGYQVEDYYTGDYHGHMEHTSGQLTKGEYKVKLPDGRVQVVSYEADHAGFRPRISYESSGLVVETSETSHAGHASHDHHHAPHHPKPVKRTKPKKYNPVLKIPYKRPEEVYSQTDQSHLMPILPTPIPKTHSHHSPAPSYQAPHNTHPTPPAHYSPTPAPQQHYAPPHQVHEPAPHQAGPVYPMPPHHPEQHQYHNPANAPLASLDAIHNERQSPPPHHSPTPAHHMVVPTSHPPPPPPPKQTYKRPLPTPYHEMTHPTPSPIAYQSSPKPNYDTPLHITALPNMHHVQYTNTHPTPQSYPAPHQPHPKPQHAYPAPQQSQPTPPPYPNPHQSHPTPSPYPNPHQVHATPQASYPVPTHHPQPSPHHSPEYNPQPAPVLVHKADPKPFQPHHEPHMDHFMHTARIDAGPSPTPYTATTTPSPPPSPSPSPFYNTYHDYNDAYQFHETSQDSEPYEEPMFIYKLAPNPKYVPKHPQPTQAPIQPVQNPNSRMDIPADPSQQDPSLYPYLYVLSSYLPKTQHSLVVAKKSY